MFQLKNIYGNLPFGLDHGPTRNLYMVWKG